MRRGWVKEGSLTWSRYEIRFIFDLYTQKAFNILREPLASLLLRSHLSLVCFLSFLNSNVSRGEQEKKDLTVVKMTITKTMITKTAIAKMAIAKILTVKMTIVTIVKKRIVMTIVKVMIVKMTI